MFIVRDSFPRNTRAKRDLKEVGRCYKHFGPTDFQMCGRLPHRGQPGLWLHHITFCCASLVESLRQC